MTLNPTKLGVLLNIAILLSTSHAFAQSTAFTYQGRLIESGTAANGDYDLRIVVFDSANGGSAVAGPMTNSPVGVSNGLFTVTLDFGADAFNGAERWIEIGLRPTGGGNFTTLNPRQQITSTPYAIRAATAPASGLSGTISPANIAAGTITSSMIANGAVRSQQLANGAVGTAQLADGAVTVGKMFTETNWAAPAFLVTIGNPVTNSTEFPSAIASLGTDRIIVGASQDSTFTNSGGAAYVFDATGQQLAILKRVSPAIGDQFGESVASVGPDKILVGAPGVEIGSDSRAGAADLFDVNGNLVASFTSPTPQSFAEFGRSVAGIGTNRVLIAEPGADSDQGRAHLFDLAGTLVVTITNPAPTVNSSFGFSVASVGSDKLAISAPGEEPGVTNGGVVHLFDLGGNWLATCASPIAQRGEQFGWSLAGVGSDKVLIGAVQTAQNGLGVGVAYLFGMSGNLLTTYTNPTPMTNDYFGFAVAAVGSDKVLISAPLDSLGALYSGTAYLFGLSGNLIATIPSPSALPNGVFGLNVAGLGDNRVVIASPYTPTTSDRYGAVQVFTFAAHAPGLLADGVRAGGVNTISLADSAVTAGKIADYSILASKLFPAVITREHLANNAVVTATLTNGAVTAAKIFQITDWSQPLASIAITNPTPGSSDRFGFAAARFGNNRLLLGSFQDEAAYIYGTNGFLQRTITNPTQANGDRFGSSVAELDEDRLLVGAPGDDVGGNNAGVVHLFRRNNGSLLQTFTNPAPNVDDGFGSAVVAVGTNVIAVGALGDDVGAVDAGALHLFHTNGVLLRTIANPAPTTGDYFSFALANLGTDKLLVGAHGEDAGATDAGRAYLFHTNGTLITTLANPSPGTSNWFGYAVAAIAPDKLLVGAPNNDVAGNNAGAAYLFNTSGTLLVTFTKPQAAAGDSFGISVAAMGNDHVLIGATGDDTGATNAGAAYVFDLAGNWRATLPNPAPASNDLFGVTVAGAGADVALIGAPGDDVPFSNSGKAYIFPFARYAPGLLADSVRAGSINAINLVDGAVTAAKIETGAVGTTQLADGAVTTPKLADSAVATAKINDSAVTSPKLATSAVGTTQLANNAVTTAKIVDDAVTAAKLSANIGVWNSIGTNINYTAGQVGIGISSPGNPLAVHGAGTSIGGGFSGGFNEVVGRFYNSINNAHTAVSVDADFGQDAILFLAEGAESWWDLRHDSSDAHKLNVRYQGGNTANATMLVVTTNGNVGIGTTSPTNKLHVAGGVSATAFVTTSDRNAKENFTPVSPTDVLAKVATLPISRWTFKELKDGQHLGPMAQDFYAAFGLGGGETTITTMDADGVALAAIQGLNQKVEEKISEIRELKRELEQLKQVVDKLANQKE